MDRQVTRADLERLLSDQDAEPVALPLSLLGEITDDFSDERIIGEGGFAVVYKGMLGNGSVAVKKLSKAYLHEGEFTREVNCLMKVKHKNVVRFLGYCGDRQQKAHNFDGKFVMADVHQRLLCFDYLPKGSLRGYIQDASYRSEWRKRLQIIYGICEGLRHLHQKSIIHCDLKPENILLNHDMVPQITDFGASRCLVEDQSRVIATTMGGRGTIGYMPPEFFDNQVITLRFDLYSLGATIIEIVTGQKGYDDTENILESWRNKLETQQVDIMLKQVRACVDIGKRCLEYNPAKRPTIQNIMDTLNETGSMDCSADSSMSSSSVEQIVRMKGYRKVVSVDVHSAKPWIVITHFEGPFRVWNYQTETFVMSLDATREQEGKTFLTAKFIERMGWIVAGGCDGYIYVFDCNNTMKKVHSFKALTQQITSLAIHPTKPYVLSASYDFEIGLWDWTNDWKSVQKFKDAHSGSVTQIAFDPKDDNAFASASKDGTVKIWRIGSRKYSKKLTWRSPKASAADSKEKVKVRCLDYFTRGNKQYLITGASAGKAKIWDVQKEKPVQKLSGHQKNKRVSAVFSHPELPLLMTGSRDGTVRVWNSNTFRLEHTLKFSLRKVHSLGCIKGSRRVVIGHSEGITIMELDKELCSS